MGAAHENGTSELGRYSGQDTDKGSLLPSLSTWLHSLCCRQAFNSGAPVTFMFLLCKWLGTAYHQRARGNIVTGIYTPATL